MALVFVVAYDGSTRLTVRFNESDRQVADLFMLDRDSSCVAADAITECMLSADISDSELEYAVSEHLDLTYQATLVVNDAVGPSGWRYKITQYPADSGRWARARIYVFNNARSGPIPLEGGVRSVKLAKWLADAMMRHWEKDSETETDG